MKRVVTLDVLRGIAIFVVILSHVFIYVVDFSIFDPEDGSMFLLILLSPLIFLGKWKGFFLMISAASQLYSMNKGFQSNSKPFIIFLKQILNGVLLLIVAYIFKIYLLPGGVLYQYIFNGVWDPAARISAVQFSDTLESIALSRILIALIYYLITRGKGLNKPYRNMIIFGVLCVTVIVLRPVVIQWVFNTTGLTPMSIPSTSASSWKERLRLVFFANLIGHQEPLFPFLSSAIFGAMYGIVFAQKSLPKKKFLRTAFFISLGLVFLGLGLLPFTEDILADMWTHLHATWMLFVNLGLQSMCFLLMMYLIEFHPNNAKTVRRLRFFRRFGMISMSIFCMELIDLIPRWLFTQIFKINLITGKTGNMGILLLLVIVTLAFWYGIIRLWELARFYGSLEVFLRLLTGLLFWKKPNFKDPLNSKGILYEIEPISLLQSSTGKEPNNL
ncbi:MAG: hypothetical protein ACTSRE_08705 [Promethearchaeota archaeon]